jgi:hypothetical protein
MFIATNARKRFNAGNGRMKGHPLRDREYCVTVYLDC